MTNTIHNANSSPDKASLDQQFQDLHDQIDQIDLTVKVNSNKMYIEPGYHV